MIRSISLCNYIVELLSRLINILILLKNSIIRVLGNASFQTNSRAFDRTNRRFQTGTTDEKGIKLVNLSVDVRLS